MRHEYELYVNVMWVMQWLRRLLSSASKITSNACTRTQINASARLGAIHLCAQFDKSVLLTKHLVYSGTFPFGYAAVGVHICASHPHIFGWHDHPDRLQSHTNSNNVCFVSVCALATCACMFASVGYLCAYEIGLYWTCTNQKWFRFIEMCTVNSV